MCVCVWKERGTCVEGRGWHVHVCGGERRLSVREVCMSKEGGAAHPEPSVCKGWC